jgi:hypothetical protein
VRRRRGRRRGLRGAGEDEEQSRRRYANEIVQRMIDAGRRDAATAAAIAAEARESRER